MLYVLPTWRKKDFSHILMNLGKMHASKKNIAFKTLSEKFMINLFSEGMPNFESDIVISAYLGNVVQIPTHGDKKDKLNVLQVSPLEYFNSEI